MDLNIETKRIDLATFQRMWNGETDAEHHLMVDALEDSCVWRFVLSETSNGSTKAFESFRECDMPSKNALIQLMDTVPEEWFKLNAEEIRERMGENNFKDFAIVYYVLLEKTETPAFYKYNVGEMYYDAFRLIQPLCQNETERLNRRIERTALLYDTSNPEYLNEKTTCFREADDRVRGIPKDSAFVSYLKWNYWTGVFFGVIAAIVLIIGFILDNIAICSFIGITIGLVALLIWILRKE